MNHFPTEVALSILHWLHPLDLNIVRQTCKRMRQLCRVCRDRSNIKRQQSFEQLTHTLAADPGRRAVTALGVRHHNDPWEVEEFRDAEIEWEEFTLDMNKTESFLNERTLAVTEIEVRVNVYPASDELNLYLEVGGALVAEVPVRLLRNTWTTCFKGVLPVYPCTWHDRRLSLRPVKCIGPASVDVRSMGRPMVDEGKWEGYGPLVFHYMLHSFFKRPDNDLWISSRAAAFRIYGSAESLRNLGRIRIKTTSGLDLGLDPAHFYLDALLRELLFAAERNETRLLRQQVQKASQESLLIPLIDCHHQIAASMPYTVTIEPIDANVIIEVVSFSLFRFLAGMGGIRYAT